jgi:hypothetical protein
MKPVRLKDIKVVVDRGQALRIAGYPPGSCAPASVQALMDEALGEVQSLCRPQAVYAAGRVWAGDGVVRFEGGPAFKSRGLAETLKSSDHACAFIVTIGPGPGEAAAAAMASGAFTRSVLLDAAGSAAVEAAADQVHEKARAVSGMRATERFSPGYCDWSLSEQALLFSLLPAADIGVALTPGGFMQPEKTISAVFGMALPGAAGFDGRRRPPCGTCTVRNCRFRTEGA